MNMVQITNAKKMYHKLRQNVPGSIGTIQKEKTHRNQEEKMTAEIVDIPPRM